MTCTGCGRSVKLNKILRVHKLWPVRTTHHTNPYLSGRDFHKYLNRLDQFQTRVEKMCDFPFQSLTDRRNASILGFTCRLLAGEGRGNLQSFCPEFKSLSDHHIGCMVLIQLVIYVSRTHAIFVI